MTDAPFGVGNDSPMDEGENTDAGLGSIAERKAAEHPTAQDGTHTRPDDKPLAYDPDEEHRPPGGEQGGQPNLSPDPAGAGRPSHFSPGATDDSGSAPDLP